MEIAELGQSSPALRTNSASATGLSALGSSEFLQLVITDLLNQDPLEPMDNGKLLQQLSSIRDIELNNEMTSSLRSLIDQQRFGSAATLIGKYVESVSGQGGGSAAGVVIGVRFDTDGTPILSLDNGLELPLSKLESVTSLERLAESLKNKIVTADVFRDGELVEIEGIVTEVKSVSGRIVLELDNGEQVSLSEVRGQRSLS